MKKTEQEKKQERKNKILSSLITLLSVVMIGVFAWFTIVWSPPDPPIPQYGIEVNFGMDDAGSGDIQSKAPSTEETESVEEPKPTPETETVEQPVEEVVEEVIEEPTPVESTPEPTPVEEVDPLPPAVTDAPVEESVETTKEEVVKPKEEKVEKKAPEEEKKEVPEKEKTKVPKINTPVTGTLLKKPEGGDGNSSTAKQNNNGNVEGTKGDQGSKKGSVNADALLESAGGSGGTALDMPGWNWIDPPEVDDSSRETGKIIFEIQIDDFGEVISVKTIYRSVTKQVVDQYREAVSELTFEPTNGDTDIQSITTGRITFIIRSK
ncbi:hypothetical protein [Flammeovirga aprica]|uniref:Uncharacterized protein n=1 Tax=Flammeovirga aprica JL-4 TaxID=694437 RepID=A0A7X9RW01_9BACT|nr:hypothetical protein [Flammeovirga aprica]NME69669.1 hypothetical protein [Flammeovirga aprica JL-4]